MYAVVDNLTGITISKHASRDKAYAKADRLDEVYGAVRYIVVPL